MVIFKLGDVISEGFPFAHCVIKEGLKTRCHYCLKIKPLKRCSKCHLAYYCSVKCRKIDWKNVHQDECEIFQKDSSTSETALFNGNNQRLVLRCLLTTKRYPEKANEMVDTLNGPRNFWSLVSHFDNFFNLNSAECRNHGLGLIYLFKSFDIDFDIEELLGIYGRAMINGFTISDKYGNRAGTGVYIANSIFDHSCMPNACEYNEGLKFQIRAMKEFDSEKEAPTIAYIDHSLPKYQRQALLEEGYFFICECIRCLNPYDRRLEIDLNRRRIEFEAFLKTVDPDWDLKSEGVIQKNRSKLAMKPCPFTDF